ncbi:acyltransferase family protein [Hydrocarboniphaga sp.]|uniref:acyltransferase family protein n=1 Tax=Hydrocarboniphaga sp. TaxID=2033016 RepID=UPI003D122BBA
MTGSKKSSEYRPQLDGLRLLCVFITIFNHVPGGGAGFVWINGTVGVDIFFALSGFLITTLLINEATNKPQISIRSFYIRRLFRIAPLYFIAFALSCIAAIVLSQIGQPEKLEQMHVSWLWITTFNRELCPKECSSFFGHSWSIGIEEKFYILWPLLFAMTYRRYIAVLLTATITAAIGAVIFLEPFQARGYCGILFGCVVAYLNFSFHSIIGAPALWLIAMTAVYASLFFVESPYENLLISLTGALFVAALYKNSDSRTAKVFGARIPASLGKLTYGVYLFHVLAINAVEIVLARLHLVFVSNRLVVGLLAYVLATFIAYVLYRLVERPMIDVGRMLSTRLAVTKDAHALAARPDKTRR